MNNNAYVSGNKNQSAFNSFMVSEHNLAHASIDPMSLTTESSSFSAAFHLPAQVISIKLDGTNFLAWSAQLLLLFRSYGLMSIVNGFEPIPPQFTSTEHKNQGILNSGYVIWQYKDQTILGWIISLLSLVVGLYLYYLLFSPFMALRPLGLLGKPLVHVLLHPLHLVFLLSRESCNFYSNVPCSANSF